MGDRNTRQNTGLPPGVRRVLQGETLAHIEAFLGDEFYEETPAQGETRAPTAQDRIPDGPYRAPEVMREEFTRLLRDQQKTDGAPRLCDACCSPDGYCTYFLFDNGSAWQATLATPQPVRVPHLINKHVTAIATNGSAIVRSQDNAWVSTNTGDFKSLPREHVPINVVAVGRKTIIQTNSRFLYMYDPDDGLPGLSTLATHSDISSIDDISSDLNTIFAVCNGRSKIFAWNNSGACAEIKPSEELGPATRTFKAISGPHVLDTNGEMYWIYYDSTYHRISHDEYPGHFIDVSTYLPSRGTRNADFNRVAIVENEETPPKKITLLMDEDDINDYKETQSPGVVATIAYSLDKPCTRAWALGGCCIAQDEHGTHYVFDNRFYEPVARSTWPFQAPDRNAEQFWPCWRLDHFGTPHNYLQQLLHGAVSDDDMDSQITYGMPALVSAMRACFMYGRHVEEIQHQLKRFILADNDTRAVSETVSKTEGIQPRRTHPALFLAAACEIPDLDLDKVQRLPSSVGNGINVLPVVLEVLHGVRDQLHVGNPKLAPFWGTSLARHVQGNVADFLRSRFQDQAGRHVRLHDDLQAREHFIAIRLRFA